MSEPERNPGAPPSLARGAASHDRPWYEAVFGETYKTIYQHRDDEAAAREIGRLLGALSVQPAPQAGGGMRVLDICCGGGRHLAALRGRGLDAYGFDLSAALLADARQRPGLKGRLVRADMRALPFRPCFDLALNLFTSFGYFDSEQENRAALWAMAGSLRPGGRLVLDHLDAAYLRAHLVPNSTEQRGEWTLKHHRDLIGDRVTKRTCVLLEGVEQHCFRESVQLFTPESLRAWAIAAGLREVAFWGDYAGRPHTPGATPRMILVAKKP